MILALGLNLINGYTGQFSLGHAGFMAVGAYVGVVLTTFFHLPFAVALLAGGAAAGFLGFLVGIPTLRLRGDYLAIATLGTSEIIRISIMNIDYVGGAAQAPRARPVATSTQQIGTTMYDDRQRLSALAAALVSLYA